MHESGLNIISARVNTESGIAQDVFYIQHDGKKVNGLKAVKLLESLWKKSKRIKRIAYLSTGVLLIGIIIFVSAARTYQMH